MRYALSDLSECGVAVDAVVSDAVEVGRRHMLEVLVDKYEWVDYFGGFGCGFAFFLVAIIVVCDLDFLLLFELFYTAVGYGDSVDVSGEVEFDVFGFHGGFGDHE